MSLRLFQEKSTWRRSPENALLEEALVLLLLQGGTDREWRRLMAPAERVRRKRKVAFKLGTRASMLDLRFVWRWGVVGRTIDKVGKGGLIPDGLLLYS